MLFAKNLVYKNLDFDLTGLISIYMTDYSELKTATSKIKQIMLVVKETKFLSDTKLQVLTNNPATLDTGSSINILSSSISSSSSTRRNRLLLSPSALENYKVSI